MARIVSIATALFLISLGLLFSFSLGDANATLPANSTQNNSTQNNAREVNITPGNSTVNTSTPQTAAPVDKPKPSVAKPSSTNEFKNEHKPDNTPEAPKPEEKQNTEDTPTPTPPGREEPQKKEENPGNPLPPPLFRFPFKLPFFHNKKALEDPETGQAAGSNDSEGNFSIQYMSRYEETKKYIEQIQSYLADFKPSEVVSFQLYAGETKTFYEKVTSVPAVVRGAYSVSSVEENKIIFRMVEPDGNVTYTKEGKPDEILFRLVNQTGEYKFEFLNQNYFSTETLKFGLVVSKVGDNSTIELQKSEFLHSSKLDPAEQDLQYVEKALSDLMVQQKFFENRKSREKDCKATDSGILGLESI